MMTTIKIAGHTFSVDARYGFTINRFRDYLCDEAPETSITVTDEDLNNFRNDNGSEQSEFCAIHSKIAHYLLERDMLLFHGSCLALDGEGILFTAPSGTGKSTHARLWRERFGSRVTMLNDDKPMLQYHRDADRWTAWGTPWSGKSWIDTNTCAPLRCIVVLHQAPTNTLRRLSPREAAKLFLQQAFIPSHNIALKIKSIDLLGRLSQIPVYSLGCTISQEAVDLTSALITR